MGRKRERHARWHHPDLRRARAHGRVAAQLQERCLRICAGAARVGHGPRRRRIARRIARAIAAVIEDKNGSCILGRTLSIRAGPQGVAPVAAQQVAARPSHGQFHRRRARGAGVEQGVHPRSSHPPLHVRLDEPPHRQPRLCYRSVVRGAVAVRHCRALR